jgi:hypothetical protein
MCPIDKKEITWEEFADFAMNKCQFIIRDSNSPDYGQVVWCYVVGSSPDGKVTAFLTKDPQK